MYCYSKLTPKYFITLLECCPDGPEYIRRPLVFNRTNYKSKGCMEYVNLLDSITRKMLPIQHKVFSSLLELSSQIHNLVAPHQGTLFTPLQSKVNPPKPFFNF